MPEETRLIDHLLTWLLGSPWWALPGALAVALLFVTPLILRKVGEARQSLRDLRDTASSERARLRQTIARMILARRIPDATIEITPTFGFVELEAEVEAEGAVVAKSWFGRAREQNTGQLRREPSLTAAIEKSRETFIVLEGDPGSGKTVALRRVERSFAERIEKSPSRSLPFPLYVNLKSIPSGEGDPQEKLHSCVLNALDEDLTVASMRFEQGCKNGGWLLLLDGFDEIPEVLSATEADKQVGKYARAIRDLCNKLNLGSNDACRIVIASRPYHGPRQFNIRFRIRPLSDERRNQFIANYGVDGERARSLIDSLVTAPKEVQSWAHNPLTLAMLCEVVRCGHDLPKNVYELFERYLDLRFSRDAKRIDELYHGGIASLRYAAENIAFVMAAVPGLSLDPSTSALRAALQRSNRPVEDLAAVLRTIHELKLALSEFKAGEVHTCFRHRRLQEYFATRVILREPDLLSSEQLLFDANWREACVVLLQQTRDLTRISGLLSRSAQFLRDCSMQLGIERVLDVVVQPAEALETVRASLSERPKPVAIDWPPHLHHVLDLLQAGFGYRDDMPEELQQHCTSIVLHIYKYGDRLDRKHALGLIGALPRGFLEGIALSALDGDSELLQDVAFTQLPRAGNLSIDTQLRVTRLLYRMAHWGRLEQERLAVGARVGRLNSPLLERLFGMLDDSYAVDRGIRIFLLGLILAGDAVLIGRAGLSLLQGFALILATVLVPTLALALRRRVLDSWSLDMLSILTTLVPAMVLFKSGGFRYAGPAVILTTLTFAYGYFWQHSVFFAVRLVVPTNPWAYFFIPLTVPVTLIRREPLLLLGSALIAAALTPLTCYEPELKEIMGVIIPYILPLFIPPMLFVSYLLLRQGVFYALDRHKHNSWGPELKRMTATDLRERMAELRTSGARIRLLGEVADGGRFRLFSADEEIRQELREFLAALEAHALEIQRKPAMSLKELLMLRVALSDEYKSESSTESKRWCIRHCVTPESTYNLEVVIDRLTEIIERASPEAHSAQQGSD